MCQQIIRAELEEWQPARAEFACGGAMFYATSSFPKIQVPSFLLESEICHPAAPVHWVW